MAPFTWSDYMPFIGMMVGHPAPRPLMTRLLETAIMSIVAGAVGVYVGVEVIKTDMQYIKSGVAETNHRIEKLEAKVEQIRSDLYVPRGVK